MKDLTKVFNCDCLPKMREFPDKWFDLAIVDPPFGIGISNNTYSYKSSYSVWQSPVRKIQSSKGWDNKPDPEYFNELFRISKNQIIWGANHFGLMPPSSCWVIWDKLNGDSNQADIELAYTSFKTAARKFTYLWDGFKKEIPEKKEHPTQKPVKLYKWLLKNYAKEGDKILDTHGGSMSSVIACLDMGFQITCYEIDTDYYNAGKNRITNHLSQLNAFRPAYDIEFHDNSGVSQLRNNAGIGYQEQKDGANNNPIHRVDGLFHGDPSQSDIQTPKAS